MLRPSSVLRAAVLSILAGSLTATALLACGAFGGQDTPPGDTLSDATPGTGEGSSSIEAASCDTKTIDADPKNCGRCGHDCLGGACLAGACMPVELGSSTDVHVLDLVVDARNVIWTTTPAPSTGPGVVYACPKEGCKGGAPTALTGAGHAPPGSLVSDGTTAYVSFLFSGGGVSRMDTGGPAPIGSLSMFTSVVTMQARAGGLFIDNYYEPDGGQERSIHLFAGSALSTPVPPFGGTRNGSFLNTTPMGVTKAHVYLGAIGAPGIVGCSLSGCADWTDFVSPVMDQDAYIQSMTSTDSTLIWVSLDGTVRACAEGQTCGAESTLLSTVQMNGAVAKTVTVSAGALYVETAGGDLLTCAPTDCVGTKRLIAHEDRLAVEWWLWGHTVFATDEAIYWAAIDAVDGGPTNVGADAATNAGPSRARIMRVAR